MIEQDTSDELAARYTAKCKEARENPAAVAATQRAHDAAVAFAGQARGMALGMDGELSAVRFPRQWCREDEIRAERPRLPTPAECYALRADHLTHSVIVDIGEALLAGHREFQYHQNWNIEVSAAMTAAGWGYTTKSHGGTTILTIRSVNERVDGLGVEVIRPKSAD